MRKVAVWAVTRNLYGVVTASIKSVLAHSTVDRIYLIAEDDVFPEPLPAIVQVINVRDQRIFRIPGPNTGKKWTWMVLMRAALAQLLPEEELVLSLDADTIAVGGLDGVWELPIGDDYIAAAREPGKSSCGTLYVNAGVCLYNLKALRADGKAWEIVRALNTREFRFCEQDALNELCAGRIFPMPSEFNACTFTEPCAAPKLLHFAATRHWAQLPEVREWLTRPWPEESPIQPAADSPFLGKGADKE